MTFYELRLFTGTVLLFVLSFFLIKAGTYDLKFNKIPNIYILIITITGIMIRILITDINIKDILEGFISISIFLFVLIYFKGNAFGGGDVKSFLSASLFLGMKVWSCFMISVFAAIPHALYIIYRKNNERNFPFGPYIFIGVFVQILSLLYGLT